ARTVGVHRATVATWLDPQAAARRASDSAAGVAEGDTGGASGVELSGASGVELSGASGVELSGAARLPAPVDEPSPAPAPPPAPWACWDQVHQVRELLKAQRGVLLRRPEHLNADQQEILRALLTSPVGPDLTVAR